MIVDPVNPFLDEWRPVLDELAGPVTLDVAGHTTVAELTAVQLERVYLPLLAMLEVKADTGRVLAGLAGIPGAGKSTFAAVLVHLADRVLGAGRVIVVGLDGWHYRNAELDCRTTTDSHGKRISLRQRKGGPESFDTVNLAAVLCALRTGDGTVSVPAYDRRIHDPVPEAIEVGPAARIVLLEGNFILSDAPQWREVVAMLSPKLFLTCTVGMARPRVVARHIRGGTPPEDAETRYERNDSLNAQIVLESEERADVVIELEGEPILRVRG